MSSVTLKIHHCTPTFTSNLASLIAKLAVEASQQDASLQIICETRELPNVWFVSCQFHFLPFHFFSMSFIVKKNSFFILNTIQQFPPPSIRKRIPLFIFISLLFQR